MKSRSQAIVTTIILSAILVLLNLVMDQVNLFFDLTEEKRFSFSESTDEVLDLIEEPIYIRVLLKGEFPAGFERLEEATNNLLAQFQSKNSNVEYKFENPSEGKPDEINARYQTLSEMGIFPTNLTVYEETESSKQLIFPYAIINKGKKTGVINLLKSNEIGETEDQTLNKSIALLEYKFTDQLYKLSKSNKPNVVLIDGRGELPPPQTASIENQLGQLYDFGRIHLDSIVQLSQEIDLVIVARPTEAYSDRDKLILDQYVMNGGKVIWIVEKFEANVFAIDSFGTYVPRVWEHNLDDLFFTYGVRYKSNLVLDLQCSKVPQVVGVQGGKPQTSMFPWFYHPIITGSPNHPTTNNISQVNLTFPSEIELLSKENLVQTKLLTTSPNSRYQIYPMDLTFDIVKLGENPSKFNKGKLPVAVMQKGAFSSHFVNRLSQQQEQTLASLGMPFKKTSAPTKQIWISDANIIANLYNPSKNRISAVGYNQWEQKTYEGNAEFILNCIDFMVDKINVMEARNKDVKLRLLDRGKVIKQKLRWQLINMVLPLLVLALFGLGYNLYRKRKFT